MSLSWDWAPGAGLGLLGSLVGWWRASSVASAVADARASFVEKRIEKLEQSAEQLEGSVRGEIESALKEWRTVATQMQLALTDLNASNRITAKTLEGMIDKMERLSELFHDHDKQLAVLRKHKTGGPHE